MLVTKTNNTSAIQHYIDDAGVPISINPGKSAQVSENSWIVDFSKLIVREITAGGFDYIGYALAGTGPLQPGWAICRFPTGLSTPKNWAGASTRLNKIWNNRTSYSYG